MYPFANPFSDWGKPLPEPRRVDVTHDDFLVLEHEDLSPKMFLRCRRCQGNMRFVENPRDPPMSRYECAEWTCTVVVVKADVAAATLAALRQDFYVELRYPLENLHKMCVEEHVGTTAYSYLRPASVDEHWEEAQKRLDRLREAARSR